MRYDKWCKRMDYMGELGEARSPAAPVYYYFVFLCCYGLTSAYMVPYSNDNHAVTLGYLMARSLLPGLVARIGVILLSSIPVVSRLVNGSSVDGSEEMKSFEACPTRNTKTVKAMIKAVRFNPCAWALVIVGFKAA